MDRQLLQARRHLRAGFALLGCLVAAGCGTEASGPAAVNMSLVAPTDGATVYVRSIVVLGRVSPEDARVMVGGRPAAVRRGTFRLRVRLPLKVNHIGILATANGYRPQSLMTTVWVSKSLTTNRSSSGSGSLPALPGYFASRAETICATANDRWAQLPKPTAQDVSTIASQVVQTSTDKTSQLVSLAAPFMQRPAVRRFIAVMRAEAADIATYWADVLAGNAGAAAQLAHHDLIMAPTWWQDAGRLGVPDCGARVVQVGG